MMKNITTLDELKEAIHALELEQQLEGIRLREEFKSSYESIKPVNLIKKSIGEWSSSPGLINNLVGTGLGLTAGILGKKVAIGSSNSTVKQLLGTLLEVGISTAVFKNSDAIKSVALSLAKAYLDKRRARKKAKKEAREAASQNGNLNLKLADSIHHPGSAT